MNTWQILPQKGISLGEMQLTFDDSWQDVIRKLDLERTHGFDELKEQDRFAEVA